MRVLFTTNPLSGHFFPLVPLAWACRLAGHEVLVATAENFVSTAARSFLPHTFSEPGDPQRTGPQVRGLRAVRSLPLSNDLGQRTELNPHPGTPIAPGADRAPLARHRRTIKHHAQSGLDATQHLVI